MSRGWFLLLSLSLGLNAGLIYVDVSHRLEENAGEVPPPPVDVPRGIHGRGEGTADFIHDRVRSIGNRVDLTDRQREELHGILQETMPPILDELDTQRKTREAMHEEYMKDDVDPARIRELARQASESQARIDSLVAETILRESAHLTPQQRLAYLQSMPWGDRPPGGGHMRRGRR